MNNPTNALDRLSASEAFGFGHNCRECLHCADIHGVADLVYCQEREKNKHPNYAQNCEFFIEKPNVLVSEREHKTPASTQD